jgi:mRNA interferase HigB
MVGDRIAEGTGVVSGQGVEQQHWAAKIHSFAELRALFPNADHVGRLTVFNIGGNTARLIAAIHYNRQKVYVRAILTHADYDEEKWKD